jgi:hypothetical protein
METGAEARIRPNLGEDSASDNTQAVTLDCSPDSFGVALDSSPDKVKILPDTALFPIPDSAVFAFDVQTGKAASTIPTPAIPARATGISLVR